MNSISTNSLDDDAVSVFKPKTFLRLYGLARMLNSDIPNVHKYLLEKANLSEYLSDREKLDMAGLNAINDFLKYVYQSDIETINTEEIYNLLKEYNSDIQIKLWNIYINYITQLFYGKTNNVLPIKYNLNSKKRCIYFNSEKSAFGFIWEKYITIPNNDKINYMIIIKNVGNDTIKVNLLKVTDIYQKIYSKDSEICNLTLSETITEPDAIIDAIRAIYFADDLSKTVGPYVTSYILTLICFMFLYDTEKVHVLSRLAIDISSIGEGYNPFINNLWLDLVH